MRAISFTEARAHLARTMERVANDAEPIMITRGRKQAFVLMTIEQYEALDETAYLNRAPANARRLDEAIAQLDRGEGVEHALVPIE